MSKRVKTVVATCGMVVFGLFIVAMLLDMEKGRTESCVRVLNHAQSQADTLSVITSRRWSYCVNALEEARGR